MIGRTTKDIREEQKNLAPNISTWFEFENVVWFCADELKKYFDIICKGDEYRCPINNETHEIDHILIKRIMIDLGLCNSQEQKGTASQMSDNFSEDIETSSVSCEHNTGEEEINKLDSRNSLLEKVASPIQNPKFLASGNIQPKFKKKTFDCWCKCEGTRFSNVENLIKHQEAEHKMKCTCEIGLVSSTRYERCLRCGGEL